MKNKIIEEALRIKHEMKQYREGEKGVVSVLSYSSLLLFMRVLYDNAVVTTVGCQRAIFCSYSAEIHSLPKTYRSNSHQPAWDICRRMRALYAGLGWEAGYVKIISQIRGLKFNMFKFVCFLFHCFFLIESCTNNTINFISVFDVTEVSM